ncbi:VOC family protein [Demequina sp.]|uniref:VOC family protein n=1 Tax=Demequina sp. TaxID=2050685 RepID=UPI003D121E7E
MPKHAATWFEIPVTDMDRAVAFYEAILEASLTRMTVGTEVATLPSDDDGVGGALSLDGRKPSQEGSLVYLSVEDISAVLARVPGAGGEVVLERTEIGNDYGFYGYLIDSEGNKVGLFEDV